MPEDPRTMALRLNRQAATARPTTVTGDAGVDLGQREAMEFASAYGWGTVPKYGDPNWESFKKKLEIWRQKGKPMPAPSPAPEATPTPAPSPEPTPVPEEVAAALQRGLLKGKAKQ